MRYRIEHVYYKHYRIRQSLFGLFWWKTRVGLLASIYEAREHLAELRKHGNPVQEEEK